MRALWVLLLLTQLSHAHSNFQTRVAHMAHILVHRPYQNNPIGEGKFGDFDQYSAFTLGAFDCQTFVNSTLALALASPRHPTLDWMRAIRYHADPHRFMNRNHFVSAEQNQRWHRLALTEDATVDFLNAQHQPLYATKDVRIDRQSWLRHLPRSRIRLMHMTPEIERAFRQQNAPKIKGQITYLPIQTLLTHRSMLSQHLAFAGILERVPTGHALKERLGTDLGVTHLGFIFKEAGQWRLIHASSQQKAVVNVPLWPYLEGLKDRAVGIHIERLSADAPNEPCPILAK